MSISEEDIDILRDKIQIFGGFEENKRIEKIYLQKLEYRQKYKGTTKMMKIY